MQIKRRNKRIYSFDILRVLACIMVVVLHCPKPGELAATHGVFLSVLSFLTAPCVPLFFMLSGALILGGRENRYSTERFIRYRLGKFISPIVIWSVLYIINKLITGRMTSFQEVVHSIVSMPFSCQEGVLWFMYVLVGLYLLTPILSIWLQSASRKSVEFYLMIWFITLCYPYIKPYVSICTTNEGILYYFTGYVGYYLLGWYLHNYYSSIRTKKHLFVFGVLSALCMIAKGIDKYFQFGIDERSGFWFLSVAGMIMCIFWWFACEWVSDKFIFKTVLFHNVIRFIANYSFGIYLSHILLMRPWIWNLSFVDYIGNYELQTLAIIIIDFTGSLLLCWLISFTPISKYVINYVRRKS